jgi:hypothetical protein
MAIASSIIAAGIGAAGAIGGAALSSSASRSAANTQAQATQQATQFQRDALQQTRIDNAPWMYAGQTALYSLMDSLGLARPQNPIFYDPNAGPVGSQYAQGSGQGAGVSGWQGQGQGGQGSNALAQWGSGPMTQALGFQATPGYQFALNQSNDAIQNRLAALGLAGSGTALDAISKNTVGYANQEYGNYLNRLASLAGLGQTSTNNQNAATLSTANNMSNLTMQGGNQRASAIMGQANAWNSALGYLTNPAGPVMNAFSTGFGSGFGGGGSAQYISPFGRY